MSLHTLANHLQQAGRGEDKVLVHMTPKEVSGLQTLAMAHGGSLSINPKTGLPEAGFLSAILPMVAGFALGPAGMGLSAMQAGLAAGAIGTVATGSLQKGLLAGLGAFGGAGLGGGLMGGAAAAAPAGAGTVSANTLIPGVQGGAGALAGQTTALTNAAPASAAANINQPAMSYAGAHSTPPAVPPVQAAAPTNINVPATNTFTERIKTIGQNVGKLFGGSDEDQQYRKQFLKQYKPELIASGLSLMAYQPEIEQEKERRKQFDPNYRAYSPGYFDPMYASAAAPSSTADRRYFVKNGGLLALAEGGAIEQMSKLNAVGANTGYPMADQSTPKYSTASANPISENIIKPQGDANVDPYTGEQKFARGGGLGSFPGSADKSVKTKSTQAKTTKEDIYTPTYNYRDPVTGQYSYVEPEPTYQEITKVPSLGKDVRRVTANDVNAVFSRYGLAPNDLQLKQTVGNRLSDQQIFDKFVKKSPEWGQKKPLTSEEVNSYFQKVWGQDATPEEVARFSNPKKKYNVSDLYKYAVKQPEYLQNLNKISQTKFTTGQEQKKEEALQTKRETAPIDVKGVASTFQDILGRPPTYDELQSYKGKPLIAEDLKKQLTTTPEYEKNLTKKFIPDIQYDQFGRASIEGLPAYKTPEQQLGLGGFYDMMNQQLAQQGGYKAVPPPPPPMQDRLPPPPAPITYQPPGGAAPPPFIPGEDSRGLPPPPPSFAMPITPPPGSNFGVDPITGLPIQHMADGGYAGGGISHLGDYSDGGRLLKGPGDGVSDSIPASIGDRQPARLADGEFVIPARIVSEIGNGSTDAGARKLYAMMDRIQKVRRKSVGKGKVAVDSKAEKYLPA